MDNKIKIIIDCPNCFHTNKIIGEDINTFPIICEDCGIKIGLRENTINDNGKQEIEKCIICGVNRFYYERTIRTFFLKRDIFCYGCDARYSNLKINNNIIDKNFDYENEKKIKKKIEKYYSE